MKTFQAYVDGSCDNRKPPRDRFGGWGAVILEDNEIVTYLEGISFRTNSTLMEMVAVIGALTHIYCMVEEEEVVVEVISDNAMIVNCFEETWHISWELKNWVGMKNSSYWKMMLDLVFNKGMKVKFTKVKGHSGVEYNEKADEIASKARLRCQALANA